MSHELAEKIYQSHGKLLITGEYVVLDGAVSLAIPTIYGQSLNVAPISDSKLIWKSIDHNANLWFEAEYSIDEITLGSTIALNNISRTLLQILKAARELNPRFLLQPNGYKVTTILDFPNNWGLGTSSTLINNIANWANVNPYELLALSFGGSGYDIACAKHHTPITYQLHERETPKQVQSGVENRTVTSVNFNPVFNNQLYFVHLNKKQNSRDGISHYNAHKSNLSNRIIEVSDITSKIISCSKLEDFDRLIETHEQIIGSITNQVPVKQRLFKDFNGSVKSLGAWGGDFVLVSAVESPKSYFKAKGYETIIGFNDMVLK